MSKSLLKYTNPKYFHVKRPQREGIDLEFHTPSPTLKVTSDLLVGPQFKPLETRIREQAYCTEFLIFRTYPQAVSKYDIQMNAVQSPVSRSEL